MTDAGRRPRLPTPVRALAWIGVVVCAGCASGPGTPVPTVAPGGAAGSATAPAPEPGDAADGGAVRLRLTPFSASYRVTSTSARLDEEGAVLEEREQEVALDLVVAPGEVSATGIVAVVAESLSPARPPERLSVSADSLGLHPVNEWRGNSWVRPLIPLVAFPADPVEEGDEWTVRRGVLLTSSELEGGSTVAYRAGAVDGDRVRLFFVGRATGNRRVEQGEMRTGRPVILAASNRTRGEAVVDRRTGRVLELTRIDELTVTVEPLDGRDGDEGAPDVLQRLRMEISATEVR